MKTGRYVAVLGGDDRHFPPGKAKTGCCRSPDKKKRKKKKTPRLPLEGFRFFLEKENCSNRSRGAGKGSKKRARPCRVGKEEGVAGENEHPREGVNFLG